MTKEPSRVTNNMRSHIKKIQYPLVVDASIRIRPWRRDDAYAIYEQALAERESLRWNSAVDQMTSADNLAAHFEGQEEAVSEGAQLGGAIEFEGRIAGQCRITSLSDPGRPCNLGYWLFKFARGKGVMTSAAIALIDLAFTIPGIDAVEIGMVTGNTASQAVAERLGAEFVEVRPRSIFRRAKYWDAAVYVVRSG